MATKAKEVPCLQEETVGSVERLMLTRIAVLGSGIDQEDEAFL